MMCGRCGRHLSAQQVTEVNSELTIPNPHEVVSSMRTRFQLIRDYLVK